MCKTHKRFSSSRSMVFCAPVAGSENWRMVNISGHRSTSFQYNALAILIFMLGYARSYSDEQAESVVVVVVDAFRAVLPRASEGVWIDDHRNRT